MGDPRLMSMQQRYETWADHALAVLIETAAVHQTAVTYHDLAARIQERSGITTDVPPRSWLGKVMVIVAQRIKGAGEPDLTALVVQPNGSVGPGYDSLRVACGEQPYGEAAREQAAAEARLACNRRYARDVPEDAQPLLHPVTSIAAATRPKGRTATRAAATKPPREPRAPRQTAPAKPRPRPGDRAVVPEQVAKFCPSCFLQLPLSGVCVNCT